MSELTSDPKNMERMRIALYGSLDPDMDYRCNPPSDLAAAFGFALSSCVKEKPVGTVLIVGTGGEDFGRDKSYRDLWEENSWPHFNVNPEPEPKITIEDTVDIMHLEKYFSEKEKEHPGYRILFYARAIHPQHCYIGRNQWQQMEEFEALMKRKYRQRYLDEQKKKAREKAAVKVQIVNKDYRNKDHWKKFK